MNWIVCLLILAGASMEVFAAMICHGSVIQKVNIKEIAIICGIVTAGQTLAVSLGYLAGRQFFLMHPDLNGDEIGEILAAVMMFIMGIRLIVKAVRRETIVERLEKKFRARKFVWLTLYTAAYTFLSGLAFGSIGTDLSLLLFMLPALLIIGIVTGIYTGYHYGFEPKTWAYAAGAALFWCSSLVLVIIL